MEAQANNSQSTRPVVGAVPYLSMADANAAVDFYVKAFAAEVVDRRPADDGKRLMHCHLWINGGTLMMSDAFPEHGFPHKEPQGFAIHLQVEKGREWWDRAVAAGCTVTMPYKKEFWGDEYGQMTDPFGITWSIGSSPA